MPARACHPRRLGVPIALAFVFLAAPPFPAGAGPEPPPAAYTADRLLDLHLPGEAARAFSALPGAARGRDPVLPRLIRSLADAGNEEKALAIFDSARPHLAEPVRSAALLEAGKIRWRAKQPEAALLLFREIPPASAEGGEAAVYIARALAAKGDFDGAAKFIAEAPPGAARQLLAGDIEAFRGRDNAAMALWDTVPPGTPSGDVARLRLSRAAGEGGPAARSLRAVADNTTGRLPVHVEALKSLADARLLAGDRAGALSAAREGIAAAGRWKSAIDGIPPWDGTAGGADRSLESVSALFPLDGDVNGFRSALNRFLFLASLRDGLLEAGTRARAMSEEARRIAEATAKRREHLAALVPRAGEIRSRFLDQARRTKGIPARLSGAANDLSLPDWGERIEPQTSALLDELSERMANLSRTISRLKSVTRASVSWQDAKSFSTEEQRMVLYAQERVAKAEDSLELLEGKLALLRARVWNRWKEAYVRRTSRNLEESERAALRAGAGSEDGDRAQASLRAGIADLTAWESSLAWMARAFRGNAAAVQARSEETGRLAVESFSRARREALSDVGRKERALHRIAGRAAAEWHLEGKGSPSDNAAAAPPGLAQEAVGHLEASLPPAGQQEPFTDDTLYALAALRFDEAERRYYEGKGGESRDAPDLSAPIATFRELLARYPGSAYAESALYGLALCYQETGAADNAAETLEALLARYPATRYADEANLRLGEHRFDQYDFPRAESAYRKVRPAAAPELRTTARFKLGWALFLQNRPGEAAEAFLDSAILSPSAARTGGLREEARKMTARSLVESGGDRGAEAFLAQRGGAAEGPAVLLGIQQFLDAQNRYEEAAGVASRIGAAYPLAAERVDGEEAAVASLRKAKREEESMARRGDYHKVFGPGTPWQSAPGRTAAEISRADSLAMEGLSAAGFHFHAATRDRPPGDRGRVLSLYDAYLAKFPSSPKAEEVAYQRGWLLFEDGRKAAAMKAFGDVAALPSGARGEASRYMALQCAKDIASPGNPASQEEIVRLAREYERAFPKGERRQLVLTDRARAHFNRKEWDDAADAALESGRIAADPAARRTAFRIAGEARFEAGRFPEAERAFREVLAASPPPPEQAELEKWVGFSMFRTAERLPPGRDAGTLFLRIAREFPSLEIVPEARFRAGAAFEEGKMDGEAIEAYLSVETQHAANPLAVDATRRLATLYERGGMPVPAADRLARLSALERTDEGRASYLFRAAELYQKGKEEEKARRAWLDAAALPGAPAPVRILGLFRAGESARAGGLEAEADAHYDNAVRLHREKGGAAPEIAGRALFLRAEARFRVYLPIRIVPPLETTFAEKQKALEGCAELYAEAVRVGDPETVSASFQRLGESFEDFRAAILSSPPPPGLSPAEKEEYVFLLEERAAPIEERAVESYRSNLRQAVAADHFSPWVAKSRERLRALRPALFARKESFAFPVAPIPDFLGITERATP